MEEFQLKGAYIELMALLKLKGIAESGGQAGMFITEGYIKRNGGVSLSVSPVLAITNLYCFTSLTGRDCE